MNDMLETAVEVGTGKGANLTGWTFGGKTGTSQEAKDALFVGYTSHMVTGVWLGNDNATKTTLSGGNVPVAIWSQFMTKAHEGLQIAPIPGGTYQNANQGVPQQVIDPATGLPVQQIDPNTGMPIQQVLPSAGQPVQGQADGQVYDANGQVIQGYQVDPNAAPPPTYVDPNTGQQYDVRADANGQQILVPPGSVGQQQQGIDPNAQQPTQQQSPRSQRTLMDLIFGDQQN
jgi:penicillin-binding protein 1A